MDDPRPDDCDAARCPTVARQDSHTERCACMDAAVATSNSPKAKAATTSAGGHTEVRSIIVLEPAPTLRGADSLAICLSLRSPRNAPMKSGAMRTRLSSCPATCFIMFAHERADTWKGNPDRATDMFLACACPRADPRRARRIPCDIGRAHSAVSGASSRAMPDLVAEVRHIRPVTRLRDRRWEQARPPR